MIKKAIKSLIIILMIINTESFFSFTNINTKHVNEFLRSIERQYSTLLSQSPVLNFINNVGLQQMFEIVRDQYPLPSGLTEPFDEYDFVIIGAGAAGCVIASRLSEEGKYTVLLLEAGGTESIITDMPILAPHAKLSGFNWGYQLERHNGICLGMINQQCDLPRGKAVGGSTVINLMAYTRGNIYDWDSIANDGNYGWSYYDVLPYFLKSERANLKNLENSPYHRRDGLLSVEDVPYRSPSVHAFIKAGQELGHKYVDYNQGDQFGFSYVQAHTLKGKRHSTARAFLYPFRDRANLHILPKSRVTKIIINEITRIAESVNYVREKRWYNVRARKEIILSAGTFESPHLLMLSGVGPRNHLEEMNIKVIQDLNVGQTMYDHIAYVGLTFLVNKTGAGLIEMRDNDIGNYIKWLNGHGPYTIGNFEGLAFLSSNPSTNYPDFELILTPASLNSEKTSTTRKSLKITDEFYNSVYKEVEERESYSIVPIVLRPKSKGYILLKDKNPFHWPKIYYDFYSNEEDLETMVKGIKYAIKLSKTNAFQEMGSKLHDKHFPTCTAYEFGTDDYWKCAARTLSIPFQHHVGTCKMGPATDPDAVVNNELQVYGIKNLRVADASVIPKPITAHTEAPSIMIGEKLSDILKRRWFYEYYQ